MKAEIQASKVSKTEKSVRFPYFGLPDFSPKNE
jgi:hypothetical protein